MNPPSPPYLGPAAHTSGAGNKPINRIVIHCTVSPCALGGARDIARYFRGQSSGGSAHYVVDPAETVQVVYDGVIAWHAPPNSHSLGVELCDPMAGPDSRWQDNAHQAMLERAATLVAQLCLAYDVPITRLSVADLKAGKRGICGHVDVSGAFKQSTHWDPGPGFPWAQFMDLVRGAATALQNAPTTNTPEKDWFDMATQDDLAAAIKAAIPAIAEAVLDAKVTNRNPDGSKTEASLRALLTNVEVDDDRIHKAVAPLGDQLAVIEATLKQAIAGKA